MCIRDRDYAYGDQRDYFDDANLIGWTLSGDCLLYTSIHGMTLSCWIRKDTSDMLALEPAIRALFQ